MLTRFYILYSWHLIPYLFLTTVRNKYKRKYIDKQGGVASLLSCVVSTYGENGKEVLEVVQEIICDRAFPRPHIWLRSTYSYP